jgi:MFS transporter, MHS family, proline/betaine transporter
MEHKLRITLAGAIGNLLEWYDFGLYGLLAPVLASLFFPGHDRLASLLGVYGGFAAGFAMRPLGAVVLGHLGDRVGRRFVLALSVLLMGISTVAVGLLPTYHTLGLWAPVLLIVVRLFQGFSVGGEFVDSVTYLVEAAPQNRRGLAGSVANLGSTAGMLLAAGVAAAATTFAGSATLTGWAWRTPFLLGGVIASAAYILRRHLPETEFGPSEKDLQKHEAPLKRAIREQPRLMLAALLFTSGYGIVDYLTMVLLPTYAHEFAGVAEHVALRINTVGQALALVIVPISGWLSDRLWTRRAALVAAFAAEAIISWEAFELVGSHGVAGLWLAQLPFAFLLAIVMGVAPAMLAEQFPAGYRVSAHAVSFNIGIGIAGGTAPMIATALIRATGNPMAPAAYLIFAAVLAVIGALLLHDRSREGMKPSDND